MVLLSKAIDPEHPPKHKKVLSIDSPLSGKVLPLDSVPDILFTHRVFGEGVAIQPSGYQAIAPFDGTVLQFPELANQLRLRAQNGLQLQIQLGIDSHLMMAEGFKRKVKQGDSFKKGDILAEFSLIKLKQQLTSILCPVTILNSEKIKGAQGHYYSVIAGEDRIMSVYI